jgi:hypothetical protein
VKSSEKSPERRDRLENKISYALKKAQHVLRLRMDEDLKELGVTTPQYAALSLPAKEPGLSNAGLVRRFFVTPLPCEQYSDKFTDLIKSYFGEAYTCTSG